MHTASLVNTIHSSAQQPAPKLGMGATILSWTDRHAGTICFVSGNGKTIDVREDFAKRTDDNGMSDAQTYDYSPNENGAVTTFTLRKNGQWVRQGESMRGGQRCRIGVRDAHHDYSF